MRGRQRAGAGRERASGASPDPLRRHSRERAGFGIFGTMNASQHDREPSGSAKPILLFQLRPETAAADSEYEAILQALMATGVIEPVPAR